MEEGNHEILRTIDFSKMDPEESLRLGPDAPYMLAQVFRKLGMTEQSRALLVLSFLRGSEPWAERGAAEGVDAFTGEHLWNDAASLAQKGYERYPGNREILVRYARILVELENFNRLRAVLPDADQHPGEYPDSGAAPPREPVDWEIEECRIMADFMTGDKRWEERFLFWTAENPVQDSFDRLYGWLNGAGALAQLRTDALSVCARGRHFAATGEYGNALRAIVPVLENPAFVTPAILSVLDRCYTALGRFDEGAAFFSALAGRAGNDEIRMRALFIEGSLWRKSGAWQKGIDAFSLCWKNGNTPRERDRAAWYALDCAVKLSHRKGLEAFRQWAPLWNDPSFFGDIATTFGVNCIRNGGWREAGELFRAIGQILDGKTRSFYLFVLSRGFSCGRLKPEPGESAEGFLRQIVAEDADPYYSILASVLLGEPPERAALFRMVNAAAAGERRAALLAGDSDAAESAQQTAHEPTASGEPGRTFRPAETAAARFLAFSLPDLACAEIMKDLGAVSGDMIRKVVRSCSRNGFHYEALKLAVTAAGMRKGHIGAEEIELLYPRPFSERIEATAREEGIPAWLFWALIREESYFSPEIGSSAGAVGLCQLMPSTAADIARRKGFSSYDLTDPADNISMGGWYFGSQLKRFDAAVPALWAYNAGPGRAASWKSSAAGGDPFLAVETVPFVETRYYIHKILVSAVFYGYLYEGISPETVFGAFFPQGK